MAATASSPATTRVEHAAKRKAATRRVPFADLVRIHYRWRAALREGSGVPQAEQDEISELYHAALDRFEAEHGKLINSYWCATVESAVALTTGPPLKGPLRRFRSRAPRFHRVSDWATKDEPEIAHALHYCDELAIRMTEMLRGRGRRICMQLVMTCACHLLSFVDSSGSTAYTPAERKKAFADEKKELDNIARDYREAANGGAQLIYFGGMGVGVAALAGLYSIAGSILNQPDVHASTIVGCLVAGAIGAIVSVIARVNSGSFALDADVDRSYTLFLGALRPWIGSVFGLLMYFAVTSGFVEFFKLPEDDIDKFYFLCVIAFAAGFSERWAQDTLTGGLTGRGSNKDAPPAKTPAKGAAAHTQRPAPVGADTDLAAD